MNEHINFELLASLEAVWHCYFIFIIWTETFKKHVLLFYFVGSVLQVHKALWYKKCILLFLFSCHSCSSLQNLIPLQVEDSSMSSLFVICLLTLYISLWRRTITFKCLALVMKSRMCPRSFLTSPLSVKEQSDCMKHVDMDMNSLWARVTVQLLHDIPYLVFCTYFSPTFPNFFFFCFRCSVWYIHWWSWHSKHF